MSNFYSWIYMDSKNNIWKFYKNDNYELCYKIMYEDGKWTKERIIDDKVLEVFVYVEEDTFHILYINENNKLKYCTMQENQWLGRTVYQIDDNAYEMQNLKVEIIGSEMNIFFILIEKKIRNHAVLMQCIWNNNNTKALKLKDIALNYHLEENYLIHFNSKGSLEMIYVTEDRNEFNVNQMSYMNHNWTSERRLYSIQGEKITFEMLADESGLHILNKYKEDSIFSLDYVFIESNGNMKESKVYESNIELTDQILIKLEDILYTFWLEEESILYSVYDGRNWSNAVVCMSSRDEKIEKYHFNSEYGKNNQEKEAYGIGDIDMNIYLPSQLLHDLEDENIQESRIVVNELNSNNTGNTASIQRYKSQIIRMKSEIKELNKKLASSNVLLQKRKGMLEEQEERLSRAIEQKQKIEENNSLILNIQKQLQEELENVSQQYTMEQTLKLEWENKYKTNQEDLNKSKEENECLKKENELQLLNYDTLQKENVTLQNENKNLKIDCENLQREGKDKEVTITTLQTEIEMLANNNKKQEEELELIKHKEKILSQEHEKRINELSMTKQRNEILEEELSKIKQEKEHLKMENEDLRKEKEVLSVEKQKLLDELETKKNKSILERLLKG